jgi:fumarylpyruvate hydrolase
MNDDHSYVFPPLPRPSLPVRGTQKLFPVHRIYCVGRNYADHAIEMGHDPAREPPFFFQKNPDNLIAGGGVFLYPDKSSDVHYEFEMVVGLAKGGRCISAEQALQHVYGYAVGLDMTRRDLQAEAKKLGRPWDVGKAFDHSAPCSEIAPVSEIGHPDSGAVRLFVNGALKQNGDLKQMIWKVPQMIAILSEFFELQPGDLIFTGTPAGVGSVKRGDVLEGSVAGVAELRVRVG